MPTTSGRCHPLYALKLGTQIALLLYCFLNISLGVDPDALVRSLARFWALQLLVRALHALLDPPDRSPVYLATDINPYACKSSKATGVQNKVRNTDLMIEPELNRP